MASKMGSADNSQRNRAYWRSRRGLLELDLLLPPFVAACYDALSPGQQRTYEALLDCDDPDVWDWLQRRGTAPAEFETLLDAIRAFNDRRAR